MSYSSQTSKLTNKARSITNTESKEPNKTSEQNPKEQDPKQDGSSHSSLDLTTIMLISGGGLTLAVLSGLLLYCIIKKILQKRTHQKLVTTCSDLVQHTETSQHLSTYVRQSGGNPTSSSAYGSTVHKEESSHLSVSTVITSIMCNTVSKPTPKDRRTSPEVPYERGLYRWEHAIGKMLFAPAKKSHAIVFEKYLLIGLLIFDNDYFDTYTVTSEARGRHPLTYMYFGRVTALKEKQMRDESLESFISDSYPTSKKHTFVPINVRGNSTEDKKFKAFVRTQLNKFPSLPSYMRAQYSKTSLDSSYNCSQESSYDTCQESSYDTCRERSSDSYHIS